MNTYNLAYELSIEDNESPKKLYQKLRKELEGYLGGEVLTSIRNVHTQEGAGKALLNEIQIRWMNHVVMKKWLRNVFNTLDRFYLAQVRYQTQYSRIQIMNSKLKPSQPYILGIKYFPYDSIHI